MIERPEPVRGEAKLYAACAAAIVVLAFVDAELLLQHVGDGSALPAHWFALSPSRQAAWAALAVALLWGKPGAARVMLAGAVLGLTYFDRTLGLSRIDPRNVAFLLQGDWAQHYLASEFFRQEPWQWPPGRITTFWHPVGTSIAYTDANPLFALASKIFGRGAGQPFQHIGLALALNYALLGAFAARWWQLMQAHRAAMLLGTLLILSTPFMIGRTGHDTLTAHWLFWAGFVLIQSRSAFPIWHWLALVLFAALTHPYLAAMVLALASAHALAAMPDRRCSSWLRVAASLAFLGLACLGCWWLSGVFELDGVLGSYGPKWGDYSANLLGFVHAERNSRFMPLWKNAWHGQAEGDAYFGVGLLLFVATALLLQFTGLRAAGSGAALLDSRWRWVWGAVSIMAAFAITTRIALGPYVLIDFPVESRIFDTFRASGRFIWPLAYCIMAAAVAVWCRRVPSKWLAPALLLLLALQWADSHEQDAYLVDHRSDRSMPIPAAATLDPAWEQWIEGKRHVVLLPPPACGPEALPWMPISVLAVRHAATINTGYLARWDPKVAAAHCARLIESQQKGEVAADTLYVLNRQWDGLRPQFVDRLRCAPLDGAQACAFDH